MLVHLTSPKSRPLNVRAKLKTSVADLHPSKRRDHFLSSQVGHFEAESSRWKAARQLFAKAKPERWGEGLKKEEKEKLTPKKLSEMSREQLTSVNRDTLFDLDLQFGRELFDPTNLIEDRNYGSRNQERADYTNTLGRIIRIHGDSPVGKEAASMLSRYLSRIAQVETELLPQKGSSKVVGNEKYGFRGGSELFGIVARHPGITTEGEATLDLLKSLELRSS